MSLELWKKHQVSSLLELCCVSLQNLEPFKGYEQFYSPIKFGFVLKMINQMII